MSMADAYRMKRRKMADGGELPPDPESADYDAYVRQKRNSGGYKEDGTYASGGMVCDANGEACTGSPVDDEEFGGGGYKMAETKAHYADGGMVDRILEKRRCMSEGGRVANDDEKTLIDFADNDFDDLALRDDLEEHYTGANSGDEDGGLAHDDMIDRVMMKRKKDRFPRTGIPGYPD